MKQFIYLDTDIVNSIIAQKEKGLVLEMTSEQEDTAGESKTKSGKAEGNGSAEGSIWKFAKVQAELNLSGELALNNHAQTVVKELATKALHDAAFDIAYAHIAEERVLDPVEADLGSFVELTQVFEFVDLTYIEDLFSDKGFMSFVKKTEKENQEQLFDANVSSALNREQHRRNENEIRKERQKILSAVDKKYEAAAEIVSVFRKMLPYNRMLVSDKGYLIPLEDKYFRDNPQTMGFKHGGYATCVGYITNVIGKSATSKSNNIFAQLQNAVNQTLISILPTKEQDLFVVHPIAVYYGK